MKTLKLSELLGSQIKNIKFRYSPENEYGSQQFFSYILLSNDLIIDIPMFDDGDYMELSPDNINFFKEEFESAVEFPDHAKSLFVGQTIIDIIFCYFNNEINGSERGYLKLSNNYYITETNFGQPGVIIGLAILDHEQFLQNISSLQQEVRSYLDQPL